MMFLGFETNILGYERFTRYIHFDSISSWPSSMFASATNNSLHSQTIIAEDGQVDTFGYHELALLLHWYHSPSIV